MKTLLATPATAVEQSAGFWARLLQDDSIKALDHLEQLVTGCEIIAALDDLNILSECAD
ncbi:MAG: hypothetical protein M3032_06020 [Verrucomicrobiota bacterium]|nr:hypothetical protein [Verrucomicrobiota bacterium]